MELQESHGLTADQVEARQRELAKMRSLLFFEQQKRKRISKIKSKAYHRIRNRQKRRREGGGGGSDGEEGSGGEDNDPEAAVRQTHVFVPYFPLPPCSRPAAVRAPAAGPRAHFGLNHSDWHLQAAAEEKEAVRRMAERASLKHKNTSKWARQQLKLGGKVA